MRRESFVFQGTRVAYWRSAEQHDNTVMLLHGLGADHAGLLDLAAGLGPATVVAPDLPGFGGSGALPGPHTLDAYAAVIEGLRRHLGLARFTLVGHSLGGTIAFAYAGLYGRALDALSLLNPMYVVDGPTAWMAKFYYDLSTWLPGPLGRLLLLSRPMIYMSDRAVFTTADAALRRRILRMDYATAKLASPRAIRESYLSLRDAPLARYAAAVTAPTLLVTGGLDRLSTPRAMRLLHELVPASRLEVVQRGGHLLPVEEPGLVAGMITEFLAEHRPPPPADRRPPRGQHVINSQRRPVDDLDGDDPASIHPTSPGLPRLAQPESLPGTRQG